MRHHYAPLLSPCAFWVILLLFTYSVNCLLAAPATHSPDRDIVGVTEPSRHIDLAFSEAGAIRKLEVKEGDQVKSDQLLAQLDCRTLEVRREIATQKANSTATVQSATATLTMREQRLAQLERLAQTDRANADELARARADREIAAADLQLAREANAEAELEARHIDAEIEQRTLRAPFDGVIARVHQELGATVLPQEGALLSLVNLGSLDLVVYVDYPRVKGLQPGVEIPVASLDGSMKGVGVVAFISPVVDASSGTVLLRLKLANPDGSHLSGVKYRVLLPES